MGRIEKLEQEIEEISYENTIYISKIYAYTYQVVYLFCSLFNRSANESLLKDIDKEFNESKIFKALYSIRNNEKDLIRENYYKNVSGKSIKLKSIPSFSDIEDISDISEIFELIKKLKLIWIRDIGQNFNDLHSNIQEIETKIGYLEDDTLWDETLEKFEKSYFLLNNFKKRYLTIFFK